jgi:hypothetical protein
MYAYSLSYYGYGTATTTTAQHSWRLAVNGENATVNALAYVVSTAGAM